ncbi:MAG: VTC domain-containing protein, partial [Caldicoprobacterales bacterium]
AYGTVVLEIKADMEKPKWLSRLVRDHELKAVSNSKYGQSIEISRPDIMAFGQILDKEDLLDSFSPGFDPGFNL